MDDPIALMEAHALHRANKSDDLCTVTMGTGKSCLPYRLAAALAAAQFDVQKLQEQVDAVREVGGLDIDTFVNIARQQRIDHENKESLNE